MPEIIGLKKAALKAGVTSTAIQKWCRDLGIGERRPTNRHPDGVWHIDADALQRIIDARAVLKRIGT